MANQLIIEDGEKRTLKEFADAAVAYLVNHPETNEIVQLAGNIVELEHDKKTAPRHIYPLPEGYEYNFSGHFGQIVGVGRREAVPEVLSTYRVWFKDGSATLINALGETQARCIVEAGIAEGKYHGKIARIEKL